jgi:hypothetical protein
MPGSFFQEKDGIKIFAEKDTFLKQSSSVPRGQFYKTFLSLFTTIFAPGLNLFDKPGNTKGGSITVPLTSFLTGLESAVGQLTIFCFYLQNRLIQTSEQGVNGTVILPPLVFPG